MPLTPPLSSQTGRRDHLLQRMVVADNHQAARVYFATPNRCLKPLSVNPTLTAPSSVTTTGRLINAGYSLSSSVHSGSLCGDLRGSGSVRQVVEARLMSLSQPPSCFAHSFNTSGGCRCAR